MLTFKKKLFSKQQGKQLGKVSFIDKSLLTEEALDYFPIYYPMKKPTSKNEMNKLMSNKLHQYDAKTQFMLLSNLVSRIENYVIV